MKWNSKVDDRTKEKIELLYREFDRFIQENHSGSTAEDQLLLRQWSNFKTVIDRNPTDFQSMNQYINKMNDQQPKQRSSSPFSSKQAEPKVDLNRAKLKKISSDLISAIGKNNRQLFNK